MIYRTDERNVEFHNEPFQFSAFEIYCNCQLSYSYNPAELLPVDDRAR